MRKSKMLFDLTNNSTNDPILAPGVFGSALLAATSLETFNSILNAKDTVKLGIHDFGNVLQAAGCSPADQGAGTLDDKTVTVCPLDVYFTLCQTTLEQSFLSSRLASGSNNVNFLPSDFETYLADKLVEQIAANLETIAWQGRAGFSGSTYPNTLCDGLEYKMTIDSDVIDQTATTVTSSNVVAELTKVYNLIPSELYGHKDLVLYVSKNVAQAYKLAQAATTGGLFTVGDKELNFIGIPMIMANGMSSDKMVAGLSTNFFKITDLVSDYTDVMFIPQLDKTGKHQIIVSGSFKIAFDYAVGTDIVYYS